MSDEQNGTNDAVLDAITSIADAVKATNERLDAIEAEPVNPVPAAIEAEPIKAAPMVNSKTKLGDDETKAVAYYIRTADKGALAKASTDAMTTITDVTYAGYAVPTGHYNNIITKRDVGDPLREALGMTNIPGVGTTVNATVDAAGDGQFVITAEQDSAHSVAFDRDTPPIGRVPMTLVKYTKKVELTDEILQDEDANLLSFVENYIGRGLRNTWSNLIVTKALADGTAALTLDGAAGILAPEVPELMYLLPDGYEDNASWVMKRSTEGIIRSLVGDNFMYVPTPMGQPTGARELWNVPVYNSAYMPASTTGLKSLVLGDFAYMGYREAPGLTMIADPYSVDGAVVLKYYTRIAVEVLLPEAIIYATQA